MYYEQLKKGMIIPSFFDYKNEKKFWRTCVLIERVEADEIAFIMDDEKVYTEPPISNNLFLNQQETNLGNLKVLRLEKLLSTNKKTIKIFVKKVKQAFKPKQVLNYNTLLLLIKDFAIKHKDPDELKTIFDEYEPDFLVRYFQQTWNEKWRPTVFVSERWLVETVPNDRFEKPFRTHRKFRVLYKHNHLDDDEDE
jgi:hypothetical protein